MAMFEQVVQCHLEIPDGCDKAMKRVGGLA